MKLILLLCQKIGITVFLYLDNAQVLANSYTQAKADGQSGTVVIETGFCAESGKVPAETHLILVCNTQNMTLSLPQDFRTMSLK